MSQKVAKTGSNPVEYCILYTVKHSILYAVKYCILNTVEYFILYTVEYCIWQSNTGVYCFAETKDAMWHTYLLKSFNISIVR